MELALRYLREVVRTEKLEIVGGSSSAILDIVLKLLVILNEKGCLREAGNTLERPGRASVSGACAKVYKKLNQLIMWSDKTLANLGKAESFDKDSAMAELDCRGKELQKAIEELLALAKKKEGVESEKKRSSADSGTGVSLEEDSVNNNSPKVPPPKPPHPSQVHGGPAPPVPPRRRRSQPESEDSGIVFREPPSNNNGDDSLLTETMERSANLFSQGSLDNILEKLNLTDSFSMPSGTQQVSMSMLNGDDSGFEDHGQFSTVDSHVTKAESSEEIILNGKKVTISRLQFQRMKHAKTSSTKVVGGSSESDLVKMLRESKDGELKITEDQHLKFAKTSNVMTKSLDKLSPYDNSTPADDRKVLLDLPTPPGVPQRRLSAGSDYDNDFSTPSVSSNDNSPIHKPPPVIPRKLVKTEQMLKESSCLIIVSTKRLW